MGGWVKHNIIWTRHSFLLELYGETLFGFINPLKIFQKRKPKPARIPPQTPPPRGRDRIPHPATISPDKRGGVRSGLLFKKGSRKGYNFTANQKIGSS